MICGEDIIIEWTGHIWPGALESTAMLRITPTGQIFAWDHIAGCWTTSHDIAPDEAARHIHTAALSRKYALPVQS